MKSAVETLSPTRVKLTVEVPFDELKPSLDAAYKRIGQQVRIPGFRPGKVPAAHHRPAVRPRRRPRGGRQRRAARGFYGDAVARERARRRSASPRSTSPSSPTATPLNFTAEVDVRPEIELPDVRRHRGHRRRRRGHRRATSTSSSTRCASASAPCTTVERAGRRTATSSSLDLSATRRRRAARGRRAPSGLSYEVGTGNLLDGPRRGDRRAVEAGEPATFEHRAARRRARRQDRRGHRHRHARSRSKELPDARRRLRPDRQRVRHPRRAARRPARRGSAGAKQLEQGVAGPRQGRSRTLLEQRRRPAARDAARGRGRLAPRAAMDQQLRQIGHDPRALPRGRRARPPRSSTPSSTRPPREAVKAQFVLDAIADQGGARGRRGRAHRAPRPPRRSARHATPEQFAQQLVAAGQLAVARRPRSSAARRSPSCSSTPTITDASGQPGRPRASSTSSPALRPHDQAAHDRDEHEPTTTPATTTTTTDDHDHDARRRRHDALARRRGRRAARACAVSEHHLVSGTPAARRVRVGRTAVDGRRRAHDFRQHRRASR